MASSARVAGSGVEVAFGSGAVGGETRVETIDLKGEAIEGFPRADYEPTSTDSVRHVLKWNGNDDPLQLQALPLLLKFYLQNAKMYSFTPRIPHDHFQPNA